MKLSVSQPEYEYRAEYSARAMSPGFSLEPLNESSKFWSKPLGKQTSEQAATTQCVNTAVRLLLYRAVKEAQFLPCASLTIPVMMITMRARTLATVLTTWRMAPHLTFMEFTKVSRPGWNRGKRVEKHVTDGGLTRYVLARSRNSCKRRAGHQFHQPVGGEFHPADQQSFLSSWFNYHFLIVQSMQYLRYRLAIRPWQAYSLQVYWDWTTQTYEHWVHKC